MSDGFDSGMQPSAELDLNIPEGVVVEKELVEKLETDAQHSQEVLDEDDAFPRSAAAEVWEYEVVNKRAREFEDALENSDLVLEADIVDTTVTTPDEGPNFRHRRDRLSGRFRNPAPGRSTIRSARGRRRSRGNAHRRPGRGRLQPRAQRGT